MQVVDITICITPHERVTFGVGQDIPRDVKGKMQDTVTAITVSRFRKYAVVSYDNGMNVVYRGLPMIYTVKK